MMATTAMAPAMSAIVRPLIPPVAVRVAGVGCDGAAGQTGAGDAALTGQGWAAT
jgi:hypothetical protein